MWHKPALQQAATQKLPVCLHRSVRLRQQVDNAEQARHEQDGSIHPERLVEQVAGQVVDQGLQSLTSYQAGFGLLAGYVAQLLAGWFEQEAEAFADSPELSASRPGFLATEPVP